MPTRPKAACSVCRRLGCTDESHKPKPWAVSTSKPTQERRPDYAADRKRRAQAVAQHRAEHGNWCPMCGANGPDLVLTADHIFPGEEYGPLRVLCRRCNSKLGARLGAQIARERKLRRG